MKPTAKLRQLLARDGLLIACGVYDALGAKIAEEAGYQAVYISGFCVEASFGYPDVGMISMTEFVDRAASVAAATERPVICDADTGFGNAVNVVRTVRELERAGVAGLHLEDQRMPKKCGAFAGKRLISKGEMLGKLHAALDARVDPDFLVIGRTDAINLPGGLDETLDRGHAYLEAGCDMILVTVPTDEHQVREICRAFGHRSVLTINESGVSPALPFAEYERLGLKLGLVTISLTFAAITAMRTAAREIMERGEIGTVMARHDDWSSVLKLVGFDTINEWSEKYADRSPEATGD